MSYQSSSQLASQLEMLRYCTVQTTVRYYNTVAGIIIISSIGIAVRIAVQSVTFSFGWEPTTHSHQLTPSLLSQLPFILLFAFLVSLLRRCFLPQNCCLSEALFHLFWHSRRIYTKWSARRYLVQQDCSRGNSLKLAKIHYINDQSDSQPQHLPGLERSVQ